MDAPRDRLAAKLRRSPVPPEVWTLATLYAAGGVACFFAIAFPMSSEAPLELGAVVGTVALLTAGALWVAAGRVPRAALHGLTIVALGLITTLVANSRTGGGAMVTAFPYLWICVYAGHFFSRRAVRVYAVLVGAAFAAALLINGLPNTFTGWAIITATVWLAGEVLGHQSEQLRSQARHDSLTGALNRHGLIEAADREFAAADRTGEPLSVIVVDLDSFKLVNDQDGHQAGDRLLAALVSAWRADLRPRDILARSGGDEFVILLPGAAPLEAERVVARLRAAFPAEWSAGIAGRDPGGDDLDACLARADAALYEEKAARQRPAGAARVLTAARERPPRARCA